MSDDKQLAKVSEGFNWVGLNPNQITTIADAMAKSGMFPDIGKDSAKAYVKIMAGQEMGIAPFQAMNGISIIQGKAAAGGDIYASSVKRRGKYDYKVHKWERDGCEIEFFQLSGSKRVSLGVSSFTAQDARDAGLLGKDNWKKYPRNMYFNRAMTNGVRTYCPDAVGVTAYTPDELGVEVDEEGRAVVDNTATITSTPPSAATPVKDTIADISAILAEKGIEDTELRKKITFEVAGVTKISELSAVEWEEVRDTIADMSFDSLRPGAKKTP